MNKTQRNYVIIGLCAILLIMAVGYAAFSTNLQIKGSTNITSNWDLHIKDGGVNPEDVIEATSTKSIKVDALTAEFACELITPGKSKIDYVIEVENSGTLNAKLDRINVTGATNAISVTTTPTNESLTSKHLVVGANGGTAKIKVTVSYNDVTTQPNAEDLKANIKVTLDFSQTDEEATPEEEDSNIVYAYHTDERTIGTGVVTDGVKDYKELSSYKQGKTWFLKYELDENNVIQNAWACQKFSFINEPVCLQGGVYEESTDSSPYYSANKSILEGLKTTFEANKGSCESDDSYSKCYVGDLGADADSYGYANAYGDSADAYCYVSNGGYAYC